MNINSLTQENCQKSVSKILSRFFYRSTTTCILIERASVDAVASRGEVHYAGVWTDNSGRGKGENPRGVILAMGAIIT
jgi:hypothetical protein